jgi:cytoskeletal protein RodZ
VRIVLLVVIAVIFLTGLVWWAVFLGNAVTRAGARKR